MSSTPGMAVKMLMDSRGDDVKIVRRKRAPQMLSFSRLPKTHIGHLSFKHVQDRYVPSKTEQKTSENLRKTGNGTGLLYPS